MRAVTVLDYGIGNLLNVVRALEYCGVNVRVASYADAESLKSSHMVLPGVGAFGNAMVELRGRGLDDVIRRFADTGRPFLGICVGMQVLFERGLELGEHAGLGLIAGVVAPIPLLGADGRKHRIPHIGWRSLKSIRPWENSMLMRVRPEERMYFVHSYAACTEDNAMVLAEVDYDGISLCAAVQKNNLHGCQFHPERSGPAGLSTLKSFLAL